VYQDNAYNLYIYRLLKIEIMFANHVMHDEARDNYSYYQSLSLAVVVLKNITVYRRLD